MQLKEELKDNKILSLKFKNQSKNYKVMSKNSEKLFKNLTSAVET